MISDLIVATAVSRSSRERAAIEVAFINSINTSDKHSNPNTERKWAAFGQLRSDRSDCYDTYPFDAA